MTTSIKKRTARKKDAYFVGINLLASDGEQGKYLARIFPTFYEKLVEILLEEIKEFVSPV